MNLFSKEKGLVLSLLNAIFIIWLIGAVVYVISNLTPLLIKDPVYPYDEYKIIYCDLEYEKEENCKNSYAAYKLDSKYLNTDNKRGIVISLANVVIVSTSLIILNKKRKSK